MCGCNAAEHLEGVEGAAENQQAVVAQRSHHPQHGHVTDQVHLSDTGVVIDYLEGKEAPTRNGPLSPQRSLKIQSYFTHTSKQPIRGTDKDRQTIPCTNVHSGGSHIHTLLHHHKIGRAHV